MTRRDRRHAGRGPRLVHWVPTLLVLILVVGAVAAYRFDLGPRWFGTGSPDPATQPAAVPPPEGVQVPPVADPQPVAADADSGRLLPQRVRRVVDPRVADRDLGPSVHVLVAGLSGEDADAAYAHGEGAFMPASTMKLLTATAALETLGPDHRFATTVVRRGRSLTLVGGGDPFLASRPGDGTEWPARADVTTLARRTAAALPGRGRPFRLHYDASLFTGPAEDRYWRADYVPDDIVSPITALWVDEGLSSDRSERVDDPAGAAAETFAAALADRGVRLTGAPSPRRAPRGAEEVARVTSAPLAQIVQRVLEVSDNEGAEVLAHHVGLAVLDDGSFAGGAEGVRRTLADLGVPLDGAVIRDGSGLSRDDRLRPQTLVEVLRVAASEEHPELRSVLTGLPVAGFTGSLTYRFADAPDAGLGRVRAKTGTLTGVSALAGVAVDRSGTPMAFVVAADRVRLAKTLDAREALDNLAGALGACRCSR